MLLPKRTRLMCQSSRLLLCPPIMALRHLPLHQHTVPPFCPNKQKLSQQPGVTVWAESAGSGQVLPPAVLLGFADGRKTTGLVLQ